MFDVPISYNCVTAHKMLEVGLMSVSLSTGIITFIHFAFLFNEKSRERKFPIGTIRSWERKVLGTKSPGTGATCRKNIKIGL